MYNKNIMDQFSHFRSYFNKERIVPVLFLLGLVLFIIGIIFSSRLVENRTKRSSKATEVNSCLGLFNCRNVDCNQGDEGCMCKTVSSRDEGEDTVCSKSICDNCRSLSGSQTLCQSTKGCTWIAPTNLPTPPIENGEIKNFKWKKSSELLNNQSLLPTSKILEVNFAYDSSANPPLSFADINIKNGYPPKENLTFNPKYSLHLLDQNNREISKIQIDIEDTVLDPPPLPGETITRKPVAVLNRFSFSKTLKYLPSIKILVLKDISGKTISTFPIENARIKDNKLDFSSISASEITEKNNQKANISLPKRFAHTTGTDGFVDIVFIGDDYSEQQLSLFHSDVNRMIEALLTYEPFKSQSKRLFFHYVDNTNDLGCVYSGRLIICNNSEAKKYVNNSGVPNDNIIIVVNNNNYGGAGYLTENISVTYNGLQWGSQVCVHELGHSFGILNDEYLAYYNYYRYNIPLRNCYDGVPPNPQWSGIVPNDSYFQACNYDLWYRSSSDSIMRSINSYLFNSISQKYLNDRIDYFAGPITPTATPTPAIPEICRNQNNITSISDCSTCLSCQATGSAMINPVWCVRANSNSYCSEGFESELTCKKNNGTIVKDCTPATPTPTTPINQYDLYVHRMDFLPARPSVGEEISLDIMIATNSKPPTGLLFPASHISWRKGSSFPWEELSCPDNPNYATCVKTVKFSYDQPGKYLVEVKADSQNEVTESNETNNTKTWEYTVFPVNVPQICRNQNNITSISDCSTCLSCQATGSAMINPVWCVRANNNSYCAEGMFSELGCKSNSGTMITNCSELNCPNGSLGNLNCDSKGLINNLDMAVILEKWAPNGPVSPPTKTQYSTDLNKDGKVNKLDLEIILRNWKTQN